VNFFELSRKFSFKRAPRLTRIPSLEVFHLSFYFVSVLWDVSLYPAKLSPCCVDGHCDPVERNHFSEVTYSYFLSVSELTILSFPTFYRMCGTSISDKKLAAAEAHFKANKIVPSTLAAAATTINVRISWLRLMEHLINRLSRSIFMLSCRTAPLRVEIFRAFSYRGQCNTSIIDFICRDSQIANQIDVMNTAYSKASINWVLTGTSRTTNSDWFNNVGPDASQQTAMKSALRTGTAKDLNVYTVGYVQNTEKVPPFHSNCSEDLLLAPVLAFSVIRRSHRISRQTPRMTVLSFSSLLFLEAHLHHTISVR
jgi:hypothetical protein